MHGLICKGFELFVRATWSDADWLAIARRAKIDPPELEAMEMYGEDMLPRLVFSSSRVLRRPPSALLEDAGHWIVTDPGLDSVRRLVRFAGPTYEELLWSLGELRARGRLAVPGLDLPECRLEERGPGDYRILLHWPMPGAAAVLAGLLRAMADDYGVLALIDRPPCTSRPGGWDGVVDVQLVDLSHAEGRDFAFGAAS